MKRVRARFAYFCACLLMIATTAGVALSDTTPTNEVAALQARVKELEAQVSTLQTENATLRGIIEKIAAATRGPKDATPFEYNGMRFYVIPAAPGSHSPSK